MRRAALVAGVLLALAGPAAADGRLLGEAQQKIDEIDYEAARELVDRALREGGLDRDDLGRAYRIGGEVAAALGDGKGAREHFVRWVLLVPDAALPPGSSPKIVDPFTAARAEAARLGGFSLDVQVVREDARIRVEVAGKDPLQLASGLRVRLGEEPEVAVEGTRADLPARDPATVDVLVVVVDRAGNELSRVDLPGGRAVDTPVDRPAPVAAGPTRRVHHSIPAPLRWPTWAVLGLAAAGTGGYFVYRVDQAEDELAALNASSSTHTFDDALAIEERGDRDAMIANVAFGVAGAAAVATILTLVLDEERVEVLPAPGGSVGASAAVRF